MRLTGTILLTLLCLLPLGVATAKNAPPLKQCPSGSTHCPNCPGGCLAAGLKCPEDCPSKVIPLQKKEGTVYSLEEGTIVTCEEDKPMVPLTVGTQTHWVCGNPEKK